MLSLEQRMLKAYLADQAEQQFGSGTPPFKLIQYRARVWQCGPIEALERIRLQMLKKFAQMVRESERSPNDGR